MERKKLLFVNHSLHSGGVEKSLVTLLNSFDYQKYDVDLQLFVNEGLFLNSVAPEVNLLPPLLPAEYKLNIRQAFARLIKKRKFKIAFIRLLVTLKSRSGTLGERLKKVYKLEKKLLKQPGKKYDAAIAFMEGQPLYYTVDFVKAKRKIGFIHGDYNAMNLSREFDEKYFKKLNAVCTVSKSCKSALDEAFPENAQKHHVIHNIISENAIKRLAAQPGFDDGFSGKRILTIARLSYQKGLDIGLKAIAQAAHRLAASPDKLDFKWYIIGIGPEMPALCSFAKSLGVADRLVFLGEKPNPYPYLAECDLYFQPSRFEGKAIAVDEACVLSKPILLADYSTAGDQLKNGSEGIISEPKRLSENLVKLLTDEKLCEQFSLNLKNKSVTNEEEILKLYSLIRGESL